MLAINSADGDADNEADVGDEEDVAEASWEGGKSVLKKVWVVWDQVVILGGNLSLPSFLKGGLMIIIRTILVSLDVLNDKSDDHNV